MSAITEERLDLKTSASTSPPAKRKYRPEIDGLRAFAVVAVIINHFNKDLLPSGYLGVDIFFVISGYVITSSLVNRESKNFWDFITGFYERRIKRLVPALVVFVLITSILICLFNPNPTPALRTAIRSLFGLSNLYLLRESTDYFAQSTELNPFAHTWSLGVEEQFYLLFPILIWFSGFGRQAKNGARNLFLWIGALTVASLTGFIVLHPTNQPAAYFLMPPRFWEMAAGCLVFISFNKWAKIEQALEQVPPLLIVAVMVGVMFLPISSAVPATIAIVLLSGVLIACLKSGTAAFTVFTNRSVVYIGLISYSLYLWHWGVLSISRWSVGVNWFTVPFQLLLMLAISALSFHFIEQPLRVKPWAATPRDTFFKGFTALALSFLGISGLNIASSRLLKTGESLRGDAKYQDTGILQQSIYCHLPKKNNSAIADCLGSGNIANQSIYLIGDSHASNHFPSIKQAASELHSKINISVLVDWGFVNWIEGVNGCGSYNPCIIDSWKKHKEFFGETMKKGDIVVFSWYRGRLTRGGSHLPRGIDYGKQAVFRARLSELISIVTSAGGKVVLVDDIPAVCQAGTNYQYTVLRLGIANACSVSEEVSKKDREGLTLVYKDLSVAHPGKVFYFDPHSALCHDGVCNVFDPRKGAGQGKILYGDWAGHFRPDYPNPLSKEWKNFLPSIL